MNFIVNYIKKKIQSKDRCLKKCENMFVIGLKCGYRLIKEFHLINEAKNTLTASTPLYRVKTPH